MSRPSFIACILALCLPLVSCSPPRPDRPIIGAKNFTEQVILGELLAQEIESKSNLKVERRFYLAGSYICNQALAAGRIDAYVEYTGTALTAILKQPVDRNPDSVLDTVRGSMPRATTSPSPSRSDLKTHSPWSFAVTMRAA